MKSLKNRTSYSLQMSYSFSHRLSHSISRIRSHPFLVGVESLRCTVTHLCQYICTSPAIPIISRSCTSLRHFLPKEIEMEPLWRRCPKTFSLNPRVTNRLRHVLRRLLLPVAPTMIFMSEQTPTTNFMFYQPKHLFLRIWQIWSLFPFSPRC